jgi:uncharacterized protein (DUF1330 family)
LGRPLAGHRCERIQEIHRPRSRIVSRYGGKFLARGGKFRIMEGPEKFHRFIVIEFPTFDQAVACFTSTEYAHAAAFRRAGAGEVENVIVEGVESAPPSFRPSAQRESRNP